MQRYDFFLKLEFFFIHRGVKDKIDGFIEDMLSNGQTTVCFYVPLMKRRGRGCWGATPHGIVDQQNTNDKAALSGGLLFLGFAS